MSSEYRSECSLHRYRTEIPNIIIDLGLDPYQFTLYCHLKRIAGDKGMCFKSIASLAKECSMCESKIITIKKELSLPRDKLKGKSLITVHKRKKDNGDNETDLVIINDIWDVNMQIFSTGVPHTPPPPVSDTPPGVLGTPKEEPLKEELKDCLSAVADLEKPKEILSNRIQKKNAFGEVLETDLSLIMYYAVREKKAWETGEIEEAWKTLHEYQGTVNDLLGFIEGTIKNIRNKKNLKKMEETCQMKQKIKPKGMQSKEGNGSHQCLDPATLKQLFPLLP